MKKFSSAHWLILASLSASSMLNAEEVPYIEPAGNVNIVSLERVLLRQDEMQDLSHHLLTLARREHDKSPEQQRASAQLIFLAQKIYPFDDKAQEIAEQLANSEAIDHVEHEDLIKSHKRIIYYADSLEKISAEPQGKLLSSYLRDATILFRNDDEILRESNDWENIVPSPDEYEAAKKPKDIIEPQPEPPIPPVDTEDTPPASEENQYYIKNLQVKTPLIFKRGFKTIEHGEEKWQSVVRVEFQNVYFKANDEPVDKHAFQYNLEHIIHYRWHDGERLPADPFYTDVNKELSQLIQTRYPKLQHKLLTAKISDGDYSSRNYFSITGPIGVMAEASIKNIPLRDNLVVCADVDAQGNLKTPRKFWKYMTAVMEDGAGGCLVIPAETEQIVIDMLILEKPEMFTKWEIFTAKDVSEAVATIAKSNKATNQTRDLFQSVQKLTEKSTVQQLSVNKAVRDRLREVYGLANNHLSAKAILIQGGGRRPTFFSEQTTPHIVLDTIQNIHKIVHEPHHVWDVSLKNLNESVEQSKKELEEFKRYMGSRDGKIYHETIDLLDDIEGLLKSLVRAQEDWERRNTLLKRAIPKLDKIKNDSTELLKRATVAAGYPDPIL